MLPALPLLLSALGAVAGPAAALQPAAGEVASSCHLSESATAWIQQALDGWEWVLSEALRREPHLPWIVLFDELCVWELGAAAEDPSGAPLATSLVFSSEPVEVRAQAHQGKIVLPNGQELPPAPIAAGFLHQTERGVVPFFALAMVDLWRREAKAAEQPRLESFFLGVAIHEMVHTLQLVDLDRRVGELEAQYELPAQLDDDVVQHTFDEVAGFREAFEAERDLFYRAALAEDGWARRSLATAAISLLDERRARHFRADRAFFSQLEDLFLSLEGLAVWSHFELARHDGQVAFLPDFDSTDPAELIEHARQEQGYWSQEEGFALFLLLDRMVPGWRSRILGPELASPVDLLRQELAEPCAELRTARLPDTTITLSETVPAGAFVPPAPMPFPIPPPAYDSLPAFCRVVATVAPSPDSEIRLEVWMPAAGWNGKLVGTGNGGMSGAIFYASMADPLARGYAVANTNTGHDGSGADASFAVGQPEKLVDFAWRAVHEMTVTAKALAEIHYGTPPRRAYWLGCSSGGRQGLVEAQRFPDDYDAVAALAPANNWFPLLAQSIQIQQLITGPQGGLPPDKLLLLQQAALSACDAKDGVSDRVIDEPDACPFDPAAIRCAEGETAGCLPPAEVEIARRIYAGVVDPETGGEIFPGPEPASEPAWAAFRPGAFPIGVNFWRDVVVGDPDWDPSSLDPGEDIERAIAADRAGLMATDPDLSGFVGGGGKLLLWHGWADGLIPPRNTIQYYEDVVATLGAEAVQDSVRLFLAPGVSHCSGGEGTYDFDPLAVLETWAEEGKTPERILASRPLPSGERRTRPLCAYPLVARYTGTGSSDDDANFECAPPVAP